MRRRAYLVQIEARCATLRPRTPHASPFSLSTKITRLDQSLHQSSSPTYMSWVISTLDLELPNDRPAHASILYGIYNYTLDVMGGGSGGGESMDQDTLHLHLHLHCTLQRTKQSKKNSP